MNHDEFAFLNQQLAAMLREGIPLEGALRKLCRESRRGRHRVALLALADDLARGVPLSKAISEAKLPEFYREMIRLGAASGDLPGVLTLVADYYRRVGAIWTRLRAMLTYPFLVLFVSLLLSVWFGYLYTQLNGDLHREFLDASHHSGIDNRMLLEASKATWWLNAWLPPVLMTLVAVVFVITLSIPAVRRSLRWKVGPFRDASLSQLASALHLLLRQGLPFRESLAFAARMEPASSAGRDVHLWISRHAEGHANFSSVAAESKTVPSLFIWIVASAGEDVAAGFAQAAELYGERARRRSEILLNLVLPCALLALGLMIMSQISPFMTSVFDYFTPVFRASQFPR